MAELKTKPNKKSVVAFLAAAEEKKREDCRRLAKAMQNITGNKPRMWGDSIVGFGKYHYKYKTGREGDWFVTGFSPRKQNLTIYIMPGFSDYGRLLAKLGKHKHSVSCLYINKLADIDFSVLEKLIAQSVADMKTIYETK